MSTITVDLPSEEAERLTALRRYEILDTPPDGSFDRMTAIAARLFDVPIALVSLVDEERIWFKSRYGLDATQIDRDPGLCASAIFQSDVYVVNDAVTDLRTLSNPLVAGEMGLRFYAAAPLRTTDGHNLGTLCVLDLQPREFGEKEQKTLSDLAAIVMDEMELRLTSLRTIAEQAARERDFVAIASHELRNPLATAKTLLYVAERKLAEQPGPVKEILQKADFHLQRLSNLISDLLDVSRIEQGKLMLRLVEFDMDELLAEALENVQLLHETHRLRITGRAGQVQGDRERLNQLVTNLLTNAVKYSPPGTEVEVKTRTDGGRVHVDVIDQGIGIAPDRLEKVFDRYHRESSADSVSGLGLGLHIAQDIARRHGGELSVESELGKGSVFRFSMPSGLHGV